MNCIDADTLRGHNLNIKPHDERPATVLTNPDDRLKLAEFRQKEANGTLTLDEMREAVRIMRAGRLASAESAAKAKKAAAKPAVDANSLLQQLENI